MSTATKIRLASFAGTVAIVTFALGRWLGLAGILVTAIVSPLAGWRLGTWEARHDEVR